MAIDKTKVIKRILIEIIAEHNKIWDDIKYRREIAYPRLELREEDIIVLSSGLAKRLKEIKND